MKKTRFIPYGYTMRNGRTVIEHGEADIIRYIFDEYIKGASLKDLAEELTARKVPYTEKTEVWDKARIARIIDNAKYTGSEIYDPIIDEDTFEEAAAAKAAILRVQIDTINFLWLSFFNLRKHHNICTFSFFPAHPHGIGYRFSTCNSRLSSRVLSY